MVSTQIFCGIDSPKLQVFSLFAPTASGSTHRCSAHAAHLLQRLMNLHAVLLFLQDTSEGPKSEMLRPQCCGSVPCAIETLFLEMSVLWKHLLTYICSCHILKYFYMCSIDKHLSTTSTTDEQNQSHEDYHQTEHKLLNIAIFKNYQKCMMWWLKCFTNHAYSTLNIKTFLQERESLKLGWPAGVKLGSLWLYGSLRYVKKLVT